MNRIAIVAVLISVVAALPVAIAQSKAGSAGGTTGMAQEDTKKPAASVRQRSRSNADARACLELPTNVEIIKCAERYR